MALVVYRMFYLDWLNLGALKGVGLTGFQVQLVVMQWFCYLCIQHPWHIKIPKDKIIHGMHPVGRKDHPIDLNVCIL